MLSLTPIMTSAIFGSRNYRRHWAVERGLKDRGLIDNKNRPTSLARDFVVSHVIIKNRRGRLLKQYPDIEFVYDDARLLEFLNSVDDRSIDIYVYRGTDPLVVRNGNGQNPLAVLDPFYLWEIEVAKTAGQFLRYRSVIGHKGSYSYELK